MFCIGNDELKRMPKLKSYVKCPRCGMKHKVEHSTAEDGSPGTLAFFKCDGRAYLAGLQGKDVTSRHGGTSDGT